MIYAFLMMGSGAYELELLDMQLAELSGVVDKFVVTESALTFSGHCKLLYALEHSTAAPTRFQKMVSRPVFYGFMLIQDGAWKREWYQRHSAMYTPEFSALSDSDWVIISDMDEIPRASAVQEVAEDKYGDRVVFDQSEAWYYLNCLGNRRAHCTRMIRKGAMTGAFSNFQSVREQQPGPNNMLIPNAGWHFSYMGGPTAIQRKLASFAHTDMNKAPWNTLKWIERCMNEPCDLFGVESHTLAFTGLDDLPQYVKDNEEKYRDKGWIK